MVWSTARTPACTLSEEFAEGFGGDHLDAAVGAEGKEVIVAGDDIRGPGFEGTGNHHVIFGIAADAGELRKIGDRREAPS